MDIKLDNRLADVIAKKALAKALDGLSNAEIVELSVDSVLLQIIPFTERIETTLVSEFQRAVAQASMPDEPTQGKGWKLPVLDELIL